MIENQKNELTLIYHSDKLEDRKMLAFVEVIEKYKTKNLNLKRQALTETQLAEIADKMELPIAELLDESYIDRAPLENLLQSRMMSPADLLTLLAQNPLLLATPIVIIGSKAYKYKSAFEIVKEISR
jgi:arsenate reductase-like glutaredoxin family protein